ncbi:MULTISPECIES: hypothetical protein [Bacillaceae]|uniref:hypothetical protein n=1 Tax=Bacillaceae TaxID=186817 RepID=UPI00118B77FF|nr:hypothetical protein [Bacillus sp. S3]QCJ44243.1 hypothetical protein FAY30_21330 [Bacillus sp. S3]
MSQIKIHTDSVEQISSQVRHQAGKCTTAKTSLQSTIYQIDSRILARKNISGRLQAANTSLGKITKQMQELESFLKQSANYYDEAEKKIKGANNFGQLARDSLMGAAALAADPKTFLRAGKGLSFKLFRKNGHILIKVARGKVSSHQDFTKYYNLLKENLSGTAKWSRSFVTRLVNEGVPIYDEMRGRYFNNRNKFANTQFDALNKVIHDIGDDQVKVMGRAVKDSFIDEIKVWDDFKGWKNTQSLANTGKALGIIGTGFTVWSDIEDSFLDKHTGKWSYSSGKLKEFGVNLGVDIGMGAGAVAIGAAAGSFLLPPLGTVVGGAVGFTVNAAMNFKFGGPPAESITDRVKEMANHPIKTAQAVGSTISKSIKKIFW